MALRLMTRLMMTRPTTRPTIRQPQLPRALNRNHASQLQDLIKKGRTRKTKWTPPGASAQTGHLVLEVNGPRDQGGVRFEPAGGQA